MEGVEKEVLAMMNSFKPAAVPKKSVEKKGEGRLSEWSVDVEIKQSQLCGEGIFARRDIPKGEVLWEEDEKNVHKIPLGQFWSLSREKRGSHFCKTPTFLYILFVLIFFFG